MTSGSTFICQRSRSPAPFLRSRTATWLSRQWFRSAPATLAYLRRSMDRRDETVAPPPPDFRGRAHTLPRGSIARAARRRLPSLHPLVELRRRSHGLHDRDQFFDGFDMQREDAVAERLGVGRIAGDEMAGQQEGEELGQRGGDDVRVLAGENRMATLGERFGLKGGFLQVVTHCAASFCCRRYQVRRLTPSASQGFGGGRPPSPVAGLGPSAFTPLARWATDESGPGEADCLGSIPVASLSASAIAVRQPSKSSMRPSSSAILAQMALT